MSDSRIEQNVAAILRASDAEPARAAALGRRVRGASKTYPNGVRALESIDIEVREGDFATLLGPSGCGKSTLLRMIGGLSSPTTGSVVLGSSANAASRLRGFHHVGLRGQAPGAAHREPGLAFVFQNPTLMPWASVERNVRLPLDLAGEADRQCAQGTTQPCSWSALNDFAGVYPRELSGGMQMRSVHRAGAGDRAAPAVDGRAVRRARRDHTQPPRSRDPRPVGAALAHRRFRHAQHLRSGVPVHPRAGHVGAARTDRRRGRDRRTASAHRGVSRVRALCALVQGAVRDAGRRQRRRGRRCSRYPHERPRSAFRRSRGGGGCLPVAVGGSWSEPSTCPSTSCPRRFSFWAPWCTTHHCCSARCW